MGEDGPPKNPVVLAEQEVARKTLCGYQLGEESVRTNMEYIADMQDSAKIGVLQCDYHYQPTRGDVAERSTYGRYNVEFVKVEGWTFEAAQAGLGGDNKQDWPSSEFLYEAFLEGLSDEEKEKKVKSEHYWRANWDNKGPGFKIRQGYVQKKEMGKGDNSLFDQGDYENGDVRMYPGNVVEENFRKAIEQLKAMGVHAITADVGYAMQFQEVACRMTDLPVALSSLQQLSIIIALYGKEVMQKANQKILVLTVDAISFNKNKSSMLPSNVPGDLVEVLGLQDTNFGKWVKDGMSFQRTKSMDTGSCGGTETANVEDAMVGILFEVKKKIQAMQQEKLEVISIVSECTELPPYSNALR